MTREEINSIPFLYNIHHKVYVGSASGFAIPVGNVLAHAERVTTVLSCVGGAMLVLQAQVDVIQEGDAVDFFSGHRLLAIS